MVIGLYTMSFILSCRIPRYSQRLRILYFIKTRDDRLGDIVPQVQSVMDSCSEVVTSGKLRKVLEVVLAFGNFMNQGRRGNAFGFKLSSLNNILDTKSSTDKDVTLLHYVIKTLESKVRPSGRSEIRPGPETRLHMWVWLLC